MAGCIMIRALHVAAEYTYAVVKESGSISDLRGMPDNGPSLPRPDIRTVLPLSIPVRFQENPKESLCKK